MQTHRYEEAGIGIDSIQIRQRLKHRHKHKQVKQSLSYIVTEKFDCFYFQVIEHIVEIDIRVLISLSINLFQDKKQKQKMKKYSEKERNNNNDIITSISLRTKRSSSFDACVDALKQCYEKLNHHQILFVFFIEND